MVAMAERNRKLPPGQRIVPRPRELDIGVRPAFDPDTWDFQVMGLVSQPVRLTWAEFSALPAVRVQADLHCVEGWSVVDLVWEGVRVRDLVDRAGPLPEARFAYFACADGYSTSLPLSLARADNVILATSCNDTPIRDRDGGPIQLVVPDRYGYKWARWVRSIELLAEDRLGYWESRGYSNTADVWRNDRRADHQ